MRHPYTLIKRGKIYYCAIYVTINGVSKRRYFSTGQKSKVKANEYCLELLRQGRLKDISEINRHSRIFDFVFKYYFNNWFDYDCCPFVQEKKRNGKILGKQYIQTNRAILNHYILPTFGNRDIREITHLEIDEWKFSMFKKNNLSPKTANNNLSVLRIMFKYAWQHDALEKNPCEKVNQMTNLSPRKYGIPTEDEVRALFKSRKIWINDLAFLMNLIAATTGVRLGEVQALRQSDIKRDSKGEEYLLIQHSFNDKYGLKGTKTNNIRAIPVHPEIIKAMRSLYRGPNSYIFSCNNGEKPVNKHFAIDHLHAALAAIGITRIEQKKRFLGFHSWRHYLNTKLRTSGVADNITRQVNGQATEEMTDYYTHYTKDDIKAIVSISEKLFE